MQFPDPTRPPAPVDDRRAILDALRRLVRGLRLAASAAERQAGLSGAQLFVLQQLAQSPAQSLNALAARTLTDPSSVSVVVRRLEQHGLVKRRRAAEDGRRFGLELTPAGRGRLRAAPDAVQHRMLLALERLPARARKGLAQALDRLVRESGLDGELPGLFFEEPACKARPGPRRSSKRRK